MALLEPLQLLRTHAHDNGNNPSTDHREQHHRETCDGMRIREEKRKKAEEGAQTHLRIAEANSEGGAVVARPDVPLHSLALAGSGFCDRLCGWLANPKDGLGFS